MALVIVVAQTVILSEGMEGWRDGGMEVFGQQKKGMSQQTGFMPTGQAK